MSSAAVQAATQPADTIARLMRIVTVLLTACLAYAAASCLVNGIRLARPPFEFDYEEGNILNAALRINAGQTPYAAPGSWPVVLNPYGPVPYHLVALLTRSTGPRFFMPRLAVLVAAALVAVLIGLLAYHVTADALAALAFAALFLTFPLVQQWMAILRVDVFGLLFSLAALCVFARSRRWWPLAVLLWATALLCKVTFVAAPLACGIELARHREWKLLGKAAAAGVALLLAAGAVLQWTTQGAFLFHQLGTHADRLSWTYYRQHVVSFFPETAIVAGLVLCGLVRARRIHLVHLYLLAAAAATLTALKIGSATNHFLEIEAALCAAAAAGYCQLQPMRRSPPLTLALVAVFAGLLAAPALSRRAMYTTRGLVDDCPLAYAYVGAHHTVLSENVGALLLTGHPVLLSNPFVYAQLVRSGRWHPGRVEQMLQRSEAGLVVIGKPELMEERWSPSAISALEQNYHVAQRFKCPETALAYVPNRVP